MLREHAAQQSYVFTGPVSITLETSDDLTTGRFRVRSEALASVEPGGRRPQRHPGTPGHARPSRSTARSSRSRRPAS